MDGYFRRPDGCFDEPDSGKSQTTKKGSNKGKRKENETGFSVVKTPGTGPSSLDPQPDRRRRHRRRWISDSSLENKQ
jgi:hypothetical protein